jgi:hypothetical protein
VGIIIAAVVLVYVAIAVLVIKRMPSVRARVIAAALFVLIPFGDQWVGLAYFKYLCYRDAGQFVSKRVDNVAGFFRRGTAFPSYIEVDGFDYVEGLGRYTGNDRELVRFERDPVSGAIRERQVAELESRYSFDTDVKYVGSTFLWYFPYTYHEQVISDMATGEQLAKQVRIYYPGGWLARFVFRGGGTSCTGDSINVVRFLTSVLHPVDQVTQNRGSE